MYMLSLIRHLLSRPSDDSSRLNVHDDLVGFVSSYILRDTPLNTKKGETDDDESEDDFQERVEEAVRNMKTWDWSSTEEKYLAIAEHIVRDCRAMTNLTSSE
ncbi:hypothetical protein PENFLA_c029G04929 [Penicillium flavigenum]|uniref:Uncharacterized protein n=1 Tax=Penicillium flavigenum TaxID=254877 RepID=A0A1V6SQL4_9EURO|nr:hypothetical protein PENFLA_c029G04929 [Penicillium flavigenum]